MQAIIPYLHRSASFCAARTNDSIHNIPLSKTTSVFESSSRTDNTFGTPSQSAPPLYFQGGTLSHNLLRGAKKYSVFVAPGLTGLAGLAILLQALIGGLLSPSSPISLNRFKKQDTDRSGLVLQLKEMPPHIEPWQEEAGYHPVSLKETDPSNSLNPVPTSQGLSPGIHGDVSFLGLSPEQLADLQKALQAAGMPLLGLATVFDVANTLRLGKTQKQPSILLNGMIKAGLIPVMVGNMGPVQLIPLAMQFLSSMFNAGYANVQDKEKRKILKEAGLLSESDPEINTPQGKKSFNVRVTEGVVEVFNDQIKIFTTSAQQGRKLIQNGIKLIRNPKVGFKKLHSLKSMKITPNGDLTRVGAMLLMTGSMASAPVLLLSGMPDELLRVGTTMLGIGGSLLSASMFQEALARKNKVLTIAIPINMIASPLSVSSPLAMGFMLLSGAAIMTHFAKLALGEEPKGEEAKSSPATVPSPASEADFATA